MQEPYKKFKQKSLTILKKQACGFFPRIQNNIHIHKFHEMGWINQTAYLVYTTFEQGQVKTMNDWICKKTYNMLSNKPKKLKWCSLEGRLQHEENPKIKCTQTHSLIWLLP